MTYNTAPSTMVKTVVRGGKKATVQSHVECDLATESPKAENDG